MGKVFGKPASIQCKSSFSSTSFTVAKVFLKNEPLKAKLHLNERLPTLPIEVVNIIFKYWDPVTKKELKQFTSNNSLRYKKKTITLSPLNIREATILSSYLQRNHTVSALNMMRTPYVDVVSTITLANALKDSPSLKVFNMLVLSDIDGKNSKEVLRYADRNITNLEAIILAEYLKRNTILTILKLSQNHIGNQGAKAIANLLKLNTTITKLRLGENDIEDAGVQAIAIAMKENWSLKKLSLRANDFGYIGAASFAEVLNVNTTLSQLDIRFNKIGIVGAVAIAESIRCNSSLTSRTIFYDGLVNTGMSAIAKSLNVNSAIKPLVIHHNISPTKNGELKRLIQEYSPLLLDDGSNSNIT